MREPLERQPDGSSRCAKARDERQLGNPFAAGELAVKQHLAEADERAPDLRIHSRSFVPLDRNHVLLSGHVRILPYVVEGAIVGSVHPSTTGQNRRFAEMTGM